MRCILKCENQYDGVFVQHPGMELTDKELQCSTSTKHFLVYTIADRPTIAICVHFIIQMCFTETNKKQWFCETCNRH